MRILENNSIGEIERHKNGTLLYIYFFLYIMPCHVTSCRVMLCYCYVVMLGYAVMFVMLCYFILV